APRPGALDGVKKTEPAHDTVERNPISIVGRVYDPRLLKLAEIVCARRRLSFGFGLGQRWQEHSRQNRDDGDDDEKLDEGEAKGNVRFLILDLRFHFRDLSWCGISSNDAAGQRRTVPSPPPQLAKRFPSLENDTSLAAPRWPLTTSATSRVATFQSLIVPSPSADARVFPSGAKFRLRI